MPAQAHGNGIPFLRAAELIRGASDGAIDGLLGPAQLVGAPPEGSDSGDWSFQTRAMSYGIASVQVGIDLWRAVIFPVRKTTRTFPNSILIGRASSSDIRIDHPSISKLHARIRRAPDGSYVLQDAGSRNGTALEGKPLGAREATLAPGAALRLGDWSFRFELLPGTLGLLRAS